MPLYAFTDCEVSISPNACVIVDQKPRFLSVTELLKIATDNTRDLLKREWRSGLSELPGKNGIIHRWKNILRGKDLQRAGKEA